MAGMEAASARNADSRQVKELMKKPVLIISSVCLQLALAVYSPAEDRPTSNVPGSRSLVDIQELNPRIIVDIRYARDTNFTGKALYACNRCFLRNATARKLDQAQRILDKQNLSIKVWDCYRPLSVQKMMWSLIPDSRFVANPRTGSRHNRGGAVDVTLVDSKGNELAMPTEFDEFTARAYSDNNNLPQAVIMNRTILKDAMTSAGFIPIRTEWWHYDDAAWKEFPLLDIPMQGELCR
jgi:D-alanyl-D-alanine dipeptidase